MVRYLNQAYMVMTGLEAIQFLAGEEDEYSGSDVLEGRYMACVYL